ncbi:MAG: MFS transporter TsgA [Pseudomonadota bacterium]
MTTANKVRITLTSFLAFALMSAVISQLGVVSAAMAEQFDVDVTHTVAMFSYLTTGVLVGSFTAMFIFDPLGIKKSIIISACSILICLAVLWFVQTLTAIPIFLFIIGVGSGVLISAATVIITWTYAETIRPQMLLITDSFYSSAGFISGILAGYLIGQGSNWATTYSLAVGIVVLLLILASLSAYPSGVYEPEDNQEQAADIGYMNWPLALYVTGAALLVYLITVVITYSWVPHYLSANFNSSPEQVGGILGRFFLGMFLGQIMTFFLAFLGRLRVLMTVLLVLATLTSSLIWLSDDVNQIGWALLLLGFFTGGCLKVLISFGTMSTGNPTARMVSFLILCTAIGSSIAPALSSYIVSQTSEFAVVVMITGGYVLTLILLMFAFMVSPTKHPQT